MPASAPPLGFGACGGALTAAVAAPVGGIEYGGVGGVPESASITGFAPAATRRWGFGGGTARCGMKSLGRFFFAREWRDRARCSPRQKYAA
jgi:hypothetical protein